MFSLLQAHKDSFCSPGKIRFLGEKKPASIHNYIIYA